MTAPPPPEWLAVFMKKLSLYDQLVTTVKTDDKQVILDTLIEYIITDIRFLRMMPELKQLRLTPTMGRGQEAKFRKRLENLWLEETVKEKKKERGRASHSGLKSSGK